MLIPPISRVYVDQNPARTRWKKNRFLNIGPPVPSFRNPSTNAQQTSSTFYDDAPFATGLPRYGPIVASV